MKLFGKNFSDSIIQRIQSALGHDPSMSRRKLSMTVCRWMDWKSENGKLKELSCRKALLELDRQNLICLPKVKRFYNFQKRVAPVNIPDMPPVDCDFSELGNVGLEAVSADGKNKEKSKIWNGLMDRFHYLGSGPLCGAQIRYLIVSEKYGYLGGLSYSSGTLRLKDRDDWIGWSESAHWTHMNRVVCNSRFLILPTVNVKNLASHILSRSMKKVVTDWEERYGYRPLLLETFVDPDRFRGVCYRAANWTHVGQTAGRDGKYANGKKCGSKKEIYLYPLEKKWRQTLCHIPEKKLFSEAREETYSNWREEEFAAVELHDPRLKKRLDILAADMYENPGKPMFEACGGSAPKIKAAHRFFSHKEIHPDRILRPHVEASAARIRKRKIVLAMTSSLKLECPAPVEPGAIKPAPIKPGAIKPAPIKRDRQTVTLDHTVAFAADGTPLGVLHSKTDDVGKKKGAPGWEKSYRATGEIQGHCPNTTMVWVGEGDSGIREIIHESKKNPRSPKLLLRLSATGPRPVEEQKIWKKTLSRPVSGYCDVEIPSEKWNGATRRATLEVRRAKIRWRHNDGGFSDPIWSVSAREVGPRGDSPVDPIDWMLVVTIPTHRFKDAKNILNWHAMRWRGEIYNRALESTCPLNDSRFYDMDGFKACLSICMVIAWRICLVKASKQKIPGIFDRLFRSPTPEWTLLRVWAVNGPDGPVSVFFKIGCGPGVWTRRIPAFNALIRGRPPPRVTTFSKSSHRNERPSHPTSSDL